MKEKEKSLSIGQYAGYGLSIILLLSGLVLLLSSCDQEGLSEGKKKSGKRIAISAHIAGVTERDVDDNTRWSGKEAEAVTETVPIGNGLLLDMRLEPVPASQLRATTPLATGKKYRVIALDADDQTYVSHGDFTVGQPEPASPFIVIQGETYHFICVSLNSTSLPSMTTSGTFSVNGINGTVDLLYAKDTKTIASEEDATLNFTLEHKFSEITLVVDCNFIGGNITSVSTNGFRLDSIYNANTMNWEGTVTPGTKYSTSFYFKKPDPDTNIPNSSIWTSEPDTLFRGNTGSFGIVIRTGAITLPSHGSLPRATTTARFTDKPLLPGKKYKLTLKFREPKFAASNIYWDNTAQKLTFAPYSETPSSVPENQYQGVFFKFGSLIGISPVGTSWNNSTTLLYVPPTGESDSWYITSANGNLSTLPGNISGTLKNHTTIETGVWEGTDYVAIPHATGGVPVNPPTDRYAIDMPLDSLAEFKGDICKYIDPAYRLPMSYEFGLLSGFFWENENTRYGWTKVGTWSTVTSDKADGTYINTEATGVKYGWTANFFPALGYRAGTSAVLYNTGINGVYWSGSIAFALTNGIAINFNNTEFFWGSTGIGRRNGYSVRCVLQE